MVSYLIGGRLVAGGGLDAGQITLRHMVPKSLTVEITLNRAERIDADMVLPLIDPNTRAIVDLPQQLIPGRDFIGVVENGRLLAAGPVWGDPFTFPHTSMLKAEGIWSYFAHRAVLPVLAPGQLPRDVTSRWQGLSLRTIAKRIVQQACSHPNADLPIDFEEDFPGDNEREYPGSDLMSVAQALTNLTEVEGGPDIAFRPYLTEDRMHVRWRMVTGDPQLRQEGENHYWDVSAPGPTATLPGLDRDGRELATRSFLSGATVKNIAPDGEFRDGIGKWVTGGTNGSAQSYAAGAAELALGVKGYSRSSWTGNSGLAAGGLASGDSRLAVDPGATLRVSVYAQGSTKPVRLLMRFYDESGLVGESVAATGTVGGTYQLLAGTAVVPTGASRAELLLYPQSGQQWTAGQVLRTTGWMVHADVGSPIPYFYDEARLQAMSQNGALPSAGFPLLETWESRQSVVRPSTLQAYADEAVLRGSAHITSRPIVARRNTTPALGDYQPGDYALIRRAKSWREPAGTSVERIIRVRLLSTSRSDGTIRLRMRHMRQLSRTVHLASATPEDIEAELFRHRHAAPETRKSMLASWRVFYRWAGRYSIPDPTMDVESVRIPVRIPRIAPDDAIREALAGATDRDRALILLPRYACLRLTEFTTLHTRARENDILRIIGKGNKERLVGINDDLMAALLALERTQGPGYYFPGLNGPHMHPQSAHKIVSRLTGCNPHSLRHAGATAAYQATKDIRAVQDMLGHASLQTTQRYLHLDMDARRRVAAATVLKRTHLRAVEEAA